MGDIPMELVNEVMLTITDPAAMLGPEVGSPAYQPVGWGLTPRDPGSPPLLWCPDEPAVGQRRPGRDCSPGRAPRHHRIPCHRQLAHTQGQPAGVAVAGGATECLLPPAAANAQGVHCPPCLRPVGPWESPTPSHPPLLPRPLPPSLGNSCSLVPSTVCSSGLWGGGFLGNIRGTGKACDLSSLPSGSTRLWP